MRLIGHYIHLNKFLTALNNSFITLTMSSGYQRILKWNFLKKGRGYFYDILAFLKLIYKSLWFWKNVFYVCGGLRNDRTWLSFFPTLLQVPTTKLTSNLTFFFRMLIPVSGPILPTQTTADDIYLYIFYSIMPGTSICN